MRKKTVHHKDGTVDLAYGKNHVVVGESLYRRIRLGKVLIFVSWREEGIICVKSFSGEDDGYGGLEPDLVCGYWVKPVLNGGEIEVWTDSFSYMDKDGFVWGFPESDGKMLAGEGSLRKTDEGVQEEWFCSSDRGDFGGFLELELLEYWRQEHPQVPIESLEERRKRFDFFE